MQKYIYKKQKIPLGSYTSSLLADLYLHHYESKFESNSLLLFRHIDDIILIPTNDVLTYDLFVKFPSNLLLTSSVQNNCLHFLHLNFQLINNNISIDIYDKCANLHLMLYI